MASRNPIKVSVFDPEKHQKIQYSTEAYRDLVAINQFGNANFGRKQSLAYEGRLRHAVELISQYPSMARLRTELKNPVRVYPVASHLIVYKVHADVVVIIRILSGRQDLPAELNEI